MPELEERFRSLARTPAPDLWDDIRERVPRHALRPPVGRRSAAAAVAVFVGAASVGLAVWALRTDDEVPRRTATGTKPVIAYTSGIGGYHIATVTLDGAVTDLTQPVGGEYDLGSAWSPSGDALAFLRYTDGDPASDTGDYELFIADALGRTLVDFNQTAAAFAWSPDGSRIAFSTFGERTDYDIVVADRDGSRSRVVTDSPLSDSSPAWSPAGDLIAFTRHPVLDRDPGDEDIYVVRPDGTGLTKLTGSPEPDSSPTWSPDGTRIAYLSVEEDGEQEVFVMNADGSHPVAVTDAPTNDVAGPVWSPDGTRIAFGVFSGTSWDVYVVDADGTGQMALADGSKDEIGPVWAPDGSLIAYSAAESARSCRCDNAGTFDIFIVTPDGSDPRRLTDGARELGGDLAWQPAGA